MAEYVVAGLGNPGEKYKQNRHNIGFMLIDAVYQHYSFSKWQNKNQALIANGLIGEKISTKIMLAKPQSFMNESGKSLHRIMHYYRIPLNRLLIVHDDLDLEVGKIRLKSGGGNAGHNGLKSITQHVGNEFVRLRIGIGRPSSKEMVHKHVLGDFANSEIPIISNLITAVCKNFVLYFDESSQNFINKTCCQMHDIVKQEEVSGI